MEDRRMDKIKIKSVKDKIINFPQLSILSAFVVLILIFSLTTNTFLSFDNIINILRQNSTTMIVAIGMTYVLILGGIDLSVGAVACLAGTVAAGLMSRNGMPVVLAIVIGVLIGALCGLINGLTISKIGMAPFIATLAMNCSARGIVLVYTKGSTITKIPEAALFLGRGYIGPIPIPVIIMIIVVAAAWVVLRKTRFSRHVFAVGGNEECARLSGVKIVKVKIIVYIVSSTLAALSGVILTMRLASGQPTLGNGLELDAIAAVVLGGTSLNGGKGFVIGTVLGALFLTALSNGLNILQVSSFWQQVFQGIIIIIAVSFSDRKRK